MAGTIDLYWIPLGAGGTGFVRMNGRIYERITAWVRRRKALDLYHTAMRVHTADGTFVVETMWPSPPGEPASRGVAVSGPVFAAPLGRVRTFRYEVRSWKDGDLADANQAIGGARTISDDPATATALLGLVGSVPTYTWGRDPGGTGDMWNSNSVISWLLTRSGFAMDQIRPPSEGRAPGWDAGVAVARS